MASKKYTETQETTALYAKAIGHPVRVMILELLVKNGTMTFGEIVENVPVAAPTVSQHLDPLKEAGLVKGKFDQPFMRYSIVKRKKDECLSLIQSLLGDKSE